MNVPNKQSGKRSEGYATVDNAVLVRLQGSWKTKSDAELNVLFSLPYKKAEELFNYDTDELESAKEDIRGLRIYSVTGLKNGSVVGGEVHRIRTELLFVMKGIFDIELEDAYGAKKTVRITPLSGLRIPPLVMHTYKTIEDGDLLVICNTLYNKQNPATHDTYPMSEFRKIQKQFK